VTRPTFQSALAQGPWQARFTGPLLHGGIRWTCASRPGPSGFSDRGPVEKRVTWLERGEERHESSRQQRNSRSSSRIFPAPVCAFGKCEARPSAEYRDIQGRWRIAIRGGSGTLPARLQGGPALVRLDDPEPSFHLVCRMVPVPPQPRGRQSAGTDSGCGRGAPARHDKRIFRRFQGANRCCGLTCRKRGTKRARRIAA
jgi:hypothetical protein